MGGVLDEVYERLRTTGPEFDGGLSNHGPMAADALLRLTSDDAAVHRWVDRYVTRLDDSPVGHWPIIEQEWREALGAGARLGDWLAFFGRELAAQPWRDVLAAWWPRLLPGALAGATHGLIRTGHAVRALREEETVPRVREFAQALGYWAARWQAVPGYRPQTGSAGSAAALDGVPVLGATSGGVADRLTELAARDDWSAALAAAAAVTDDEAPAAIDALVDAAVGRYGRWAPGSPVMLVHAATAPRAAGLVLPSLPRTLWSATYAAAWSVSASIVGAYRPSTELADPPDVTLEEILAALLRTGDEHAIKFAETAADAAGRGVHGARGAALRAATLIG